MLVDAQRQKPQDIGGQSHAPLHLGHHVRGRLDVHQRIMGLAALLNLVGEGLEPPVLGLPDLTAAILDDLAELIDHRLYLLRRDLLARQENMLVKWHEDFCLSSQVVHSGAEPLLRPVQTANQRYERPQRRHQRAETPAARDPTPTHAPGPSARPPFSFPPEWFRTAPLIREPASTARLFHPVSLTVPAEPCLKRGK